MPAPPLTTHARRPSRRRPHAKCPRAAGADARRQPVVRRTDVEHAAADTTAVGRRLRSERECGSARAGARSRRSSAHRLRHTAGGGGTAAGDAARCGRPRRAAQQPHARREDPRAVVLRAWRGLDARRKLECPDVEFVCRTILEHCTATHNPREKQRVARREARAARGADPPAAAPRRRGAPPGADTKASHARRGGARRRTGHTAAASGGRSRRCTRGRAIRRRSAASAPPRRKRSQRRPGRRRGRAARR